MMMKKIDKFRKEIIYYILIGLLLWQLMFLNTHDFEQFPWYIQYLPSLIFTIIIGWIIIVVIYILIFWDGFEKD